MTNKQMDSLVVLALLAALKRQDAHVRLQLARLTVDQLRELLWTLIYLLNIADDMYEGYRRDNA